MHRAYSESLQNFVQDEDDTSDSWTDIPDEEFEPEVAVDDDEGFRYNAYGDHMELFYNFLDQLDSIVDVSESVQIFPENEILVMKRNILPPAA